MSHIGVARISGLALATALAAACVCRAAVIELHERAAIDGDRILLSELGEIAAASDEAEALGRVDIGPAPLPGRERTLTVGYLKMRLRRCGIDCASVTFAGAHEVRVSGPPAAAPLRVEPGADDAADVQAGGGEAAPAPVLVPRGTRVRLAVVCGTVRIVADATTQEKAAVGAIVRVRVAQTRETVTAQLIGPTEALITRE